MLIHTAWLRSMPLIWLLLLLSLTADLGAATLVRGPYLQQPGPGQVVIRWRTQEKTDAVVAFGTAPASLDRRVSDSRRVTDHEVKLEGLVPGQRYYYSIGDSASVIASGDAYFFFTAPSPGTSVPTRIWVLGDAGSQSGSDGPAVRDGFRAWSGGRRADMMLLLGDNAYRAGLDHQYQVSVFDRFRDDLRNTPLWSAIGNHDGNKAGSREASADSVRQTGPYYDIFSFPTRGEAGGTASNTEAYYAFDHGDIHVIVLDSYFATDEREQFDERMVEWLKSDLANQSARWIIAAWHHSPYSKGSHDSDTARRETYMRQTILPILEAHGVDLVLTGHSHAYERSFFLHGHYGRSSEIGDEPAVVLDGGNGRKAGVVLADGVPPDSPYFKRRSGPGTVYVVTGSASSVSSRGGLDHPAMAVSRRELGSVVVDVVDNEMTVYFIAPSGEVRDRFTIVKGEEEAPGTGDGGDGDSGPPSDGETFPPPVRGAVIERRISSGANDVEERADGSVYRDSSDLELVYDRQEQIVGLRFNKLDLPAGATVTNAWIQFEVDEVNTRDTTLFLRAERSGYAKKFGKRAFDLSSRPLTRAQVVWSPPAWRKKSAHGAAQKTPDLSPLLQEVVDEAGWQRGGAMVFVVSGSGKRVAESFEGEPAAAPLLHIEYDYE